MTRSTGLKVAASALAIALAAAAWPAAQAMRPSNDAAKLERQAGNAANQARTLAARHRFADALPFAEQAVAGSPRDAGYRMLLADLYLRNGRYQSAAATYRDVVSLDPGNQRAALSLALCEVSQGRNAEAIAVLDSVADSAPPADVGLAYALAGQVQRGIALLEPAAHAPGASGRVRQNLAFAYAMAGDWEKARATAAQDVSPADLGPRLAQWAQLARPSSAADQVAALLGVRPAADSGQPERLALNSAPSGNALAAADPAPAPQAAPEPAAAPAPVQVAADPRPAPAAPQAPVAVAAASSNAPGWTADIQSARDPRPAARSSAHGAPAARLQPAVLRAGHGLRPRLASLALQSGPVPAAVSDHGHFVVQLGAFVQPNNVEHAWAQLMKRYGFSALTPFSTTIDVPGKGTLHRLSVASFTSRDDAERTCHGIRARGGDCFVRAVAGDAPPRWASRYVHKTAIASR
ncbi:MAG TPA: tetratricopeptide repeat protein [Allosphingosinicella sp.]|nr:tetratricopeptide repeat protein [Allosphingosinicella sp.]